MSHWRRIHDCFIGKGRSADLIFTHNQECPKAAISRDFSPNLPVEQVHRA